MKYLSFIILFVSMIFIGCQDDILSPEPTTKLSYTVESELAKDYTEFCVQANWGNGYEDSILARAEYSSNVVLSWEVENSKVNDYALFKISGRNDSLETLYILKSTINPRCDSLVFQRQRKNEERK